MDVKQCEREETNKLCGPRKKEKRSQTSISLPMFPMAALGFPGPESDVDNSKQALQYILYTLWYLSPCVYYTEKVKFN